WRLRVQGGFASGDANPTGDVSLKTFTFDRDYSVGLFMFEQPLPTLAETVARSNDTNGGRDVTQAEAIENALGFSGDAVSNAIFAKPTVSRRIVDGLWVEGSWLGARMAKAPKIGTTSTSR